MLKENTEKLEDNTEIREQARKLAESPIVFEEELLPNRKLYTEEEVRRLVSKALYDYHGNPFIMSSNFTISEEWFNKNKKK